MASLDFERKTLEILKAQKDDLFDLKVQALIDRSLLDLMVMTMATNGSLDARFFETARVRSTSTKRLAAMW